MKKRGIIFFTCFIIILISIFVGGENITAECTDGETQQCGSTDMGECEFGIQTCTDGEWGECEGAIEPSTEICDDTLDNDCDGLIDCDDDDCFFDLICIEGEKENETITNETITNETITNETITNETITNETITNETITNETITNETTDITVTKETVQKAYYIIEFKKEPVLKKFKDAFPKKEKESKIQGKVTGAASLGSYEEELELEHFLALNDIENILSDNETTLVPEAVTSLVIAVKVAMFKITGFAVFIANDPNGIRPSLEFYNVFNGVVLEISEEEVEKIKQSTYVKGVYPDLEVTTTLMDSVPLINADDVWELTDSNGELITGKGVIIAVIDTGVDYTHPDLGGCLGPGCKVIGGYDIVNNDNDPMDDHGHGTHCAGTAAGNGALKGVAPDADILAYKVLNNWGSGTFSWVMGGIEMAVDPDQDGDFSDHADVISMSLGAYCGTYSSYCGPDDSMSRTIDNAVDAGVVSVIAAGNENGASNRIRSPGTARKAFTIGATTKLDRLAYFSSRGPVVWLGETIDKPDIAAPGVNICAAQWDNAWSYSQCLDTEHTAISGTSMATPHVAGAVALLLQQNPALTPEDIKNTLKDSAVSLPYTKYEVGAGRLDSLAAHDLLPGARCNEGETRICGTDVGECKKGNQTCVNETWGECVGSIEPILEICDGLDNDCDGLIDDSLAPELCEEQRGVCKYSVKQCEGSSGWLPCNSSNYGPYYDYPKELRCSDRKDNDCDGKIDLKDTEDCQCTLKNAYWNQTSAFKGDKVKLFIIGDTCQWLPVNLEIKEKSLLGDKTVLHYPSIRFRRDSTLPIYWIAEHNKLIGDPEYYGVADLLNSTEKINSKDLENGILTVTIAPDSDGDGVDDRIDACPFTPNFLKDYVNRYGCPIPIAYGFDIRPNFGNITLFNLSRFEIGKRDFGKISYFKRLKLLKRTGIYYERVDLDSNIKISKHKIEVNTTELPMLNESANITMYNVDLENPVIFKDGAVCGECELLYWNKNTRTAVFSVPHFTIYELIEGGSEGNGGTDGGNGGGDSGGTAPSLFPRTCQEEWSCGEWSECENERQTRSCQDINNCGTSIEKPNIGRTCGEEDQTEERLYERLSKIGTTGITKSFKDNQILSFAIVFIILALIVFIVIRIIRKKVMY